MTVHSSWVVSCGAALATALAAAACSSPSSSSAAPRPGYVASAQLLTNITQSCIAAGPGGTFVGIGPTFTANAQAVVLAAESGAQRLVAMGFNSIGGCAYDRVADVLYVTDNADNASLGISTGPAGNTGAQTGKTIFAIPSASTASGLSAPALALLPPDSIEFAASVAVDGDGNVLVANAAAAPAGAVLKIASGANLSTFVADLSLPSGIAVDPASGDVFVGENLGLPNFDNQLLRFDNTGAPIEPVPFAGPSTAFGSIGLLFDEAMYEGEGGLLAAGAYGGDVASFDVATGSSTPFASGLTYANGMALDPFTGRVQILSSSFTGAAEDRSLFRFTPIDRLVPGGANATTACLQEFYGIEITGKDATCTDGAPCDGDGKVDGFCLFPLGFCFNVPDEALPGCQPATISAVAIETTPPNPATAEVAGRIASALPYTGPTCAFSDGIAVPVRAPGVSGAASVRVETATTDSRKNSAGVTMVCEPAR